MNDYAPAQPAAISKAGFFPAMAPWILLTIATGLVLFDAIDGSFRQEALSAFLGLSLGAMALAAAGWSIAVLAGFQRLRGNAPVLIGIGQIAFVGWIYLRTVLNATAGHFVHAQLPVSAWELFLCLGLLLYAASRRQKMADAKEVLPSLIWVLVAILIIAQRELPRDIMLSSDPDQHLFWTLQVLKWGGVPFDLGDWGPLDFQYPAGFAVLSSLWTWLSFTTAANSVTIQPLLQSILAVLGLANSVAILVGSAQTKLKFTMGFMAVALFFGFFPSTLLKEFFLLEKSGSLSTQLLLISIVFLLLEKQVAEKSLLKNPAFYLAGIGVAWSGLINPVAIIIPGILYYVSLAVSSWHQYKNRRNFLLGFAVLAAIPAAFMLLDPYYSFRFVIQRPTPLADIPPGFIVDQLSVATEVKAYLLKLVGRAEFVRPMLMLKYFAHPILSAGFIVLTFSAIFVLTKSTRRLATFKYILFVPVFCVILQFSILPIFYAIRNKGDLYLLEPYFMEAINRLAYLWCMAVFFYAAALIFKRCDTHKNGIAGCLIVMAALLIPLWALRDSLPSEVYVKTRFDWCVLNDCNTSDDELVLLALRQEYAKMVLAQGEAPGKAQLPRVLVPNELRDIWRERWLLPVGTARNLPAKTDFPLAFFYYKGDSDFNFKNYRDHVCQKFDIEWLKARRIKYLYLPSDAEKACVAEIDMSPNNIKVIFRSGRAALLEIQ